MHKTRILVLPLDERPCNTDLVEKIAFLDKNFSLDIIPRSLLGNKKNPADVEGIVRFLEQNIKRYDYLVLSIDMLLYGGLLPSRLHSFEEKELINRLEIINKLRSLNENIKIYAFDTIMRTPKYDSSDEEPDYYEDFGYKIFKKKYLEDKMTLTDEERTELQSIKIPTEFLLDYEKRREKNINLTKKVIGLLESEMIDYLIIPQDDSAPYGYTRIDQESTYSIINNVPAEKVSVHPGADEVALTLISRIHNEIDPIKMYVYETSDSTKIIPNYEDREASKSLQLHLNACKVQLVSTPEDADLILLYHLPTSEMQESWDQKEDEKDFVDLLQFLGSTEKKIAIADCYYSNGGDRKLIQLISDNNLFDRVCAYQAWNTNCNTVGSAVANGIFAHQSSKSKIRKLVFAHVLEDCYFQSLVRMKVTNEHLSGMGLNYFDLKDKQDEIVAIEKVMLKNKMQNLNLEQYEFNIYHPWNRMFEIGVDVE